MTNEKFDTPGRLMRETLILVRKEQRGLLAIYQRTGIPFYWLRKFAAGQIQNPSGNRLEYLYEKLSGEKLFS